MGIDGKPNRIAHYFKDVAQPTEHAKIAIGLHLSKSQATTAGLGNKPLTHEITGRGYADCLGKAEDFIQANFKGCTL